MKCLQNSCFCIQVIIFCLAIGREPVNLDFGYANMESQNGCNDSTSSTPSLTCDPTRLSCQFIESMFQEDTLKRKRFQSVKDAEKALLDGQIWGMLIIQSNFSSNVLNKIGSSKVEVTLDQSNQQVNIFYLFYINQIVMF